MSIIESLKRVVGSEGFEVSTHGDETWLVRPGEGAWAIKSLADVAREKDGGRLPDHYSDKRLLKAVAAVHRARLKAGKPQNGRGAATLGALTVFLAVGFMGISLLYQMQLKTPLRGDIQAQGTLSQTGNGGYCSAPAQEPTASSDGYDREREAAQIEKLISEVEQLGGELIAESQADLERTRNLGNNQRSGRPAPRGGNRSGKTNEYAFGYE